MALKVKTTTEIHNVVLRGEEGEDLATFDIKILEPAEFEKIINKHRKIEWDSPTKRVKKERFETPKFAAISEERFVEMVQDWDGILDPDGQPLPCTKANKQTVYKHNPGLVEWIFAKADEISNLEISKYKEEEKNSESGPNGENEK